jgi:hypothetical protein
MDLVTRGGRGKERNVPIRTDKWEEGLRCLFDGLVERLRRRMAILTEDLVLGEEHALCEREERLVKIREN